MHSPEFRSIDSYIEPSLGLLENYFDPRIDAVLTGIDQTKSHGFEMIARSFILGVDSIKADRPRPVGFAWRAYRLGHIIASAAMPHMPEMAMGTLIERCADKDELYATLHYGSKDALRDSGNYAAIMGRYKINIDPELEEPEIVDLFSGIALMAMNIAEKERARMNELACFSEEITKLGSDAGVDWDMELSKLNLGR